VFYGRNGAGKTQILEAIAYAADFKLSAYEGFILHNPQISGIPYSYPDLQEIYSWQIYEKKVFILGISPKQLLARYQAIDSEDTWLGFTVGFNANEVFDENEELVLSILGEFLAAKNALLTRSPVKEDPSCDDPDLMNAPEFIQIVPMLLPSDPAPITRRHAMEIHASYLDLVERIETHSKAASDPSLTVDESNALFLDGEEERDKLFDEWVSTWSWSPLINVRNLGYNDGYSFIGDNGKGNIFDAENLPIFIPAAISYDTAREYKEFRSRHESSVSLLLTSLSLTKESDLPRLPNWFTAQREEEDLSTITHEDIGYINPGSKSEIVNQPEVYQKLLMTYLAQLKSKLRFLPNYRSLEIRESEYRRFPWLIINDNVSASRGSAAERRWLYLAKKSIRTSTQWVVIDEPESGLHRTAEAELAQVLASSSWNQGSIVAVATHSPEFLDLPHAHVNHVENGKVRELTSVDREDLLALGLRPGDLLGQIRIFLLVEGEHERVIFENLFGSELRRAGCKIIVARGAKNMKDVFESQMIFHFSDATIVSLLDNIDSTTVNSIWSDAKKMAERGKLIEAGQFIRASLPGKNHSENTFLSQFLTLALADGQYERVEVWGLNKADIVLYFDPADFGIKRGWDELLALHTKSDPSFKEWATKKYGADFTVQTIDRVSRNIKVAPDEFGGLMLRISELSFRTQE
jgi:ABC-type branched-subunit amino acid transport system ATPase component